MPFILLHFPLEKLLKLFIWLENIKTYVSAIVKLYEDTIIGYLRESDTTQLLLRIVQCCHLCDVDEDNFALPVVLYCSAMMYWYYYCLGVLPIKHNKKGTYTHEEKINCIPNFIKNSLPYNYINYGFSMYNDNTIILKQEVVPLMTDSTIPLDYCHKKNM